MGKPKTMTFEERLQRLQMIVTGLEGGALPLEQSVSLYKEGLILTRACRDQLDKARHEVHLLADGVLTPFDTEPDASSTAEQEHDHA